MRRKTKGAVLGLLSVLVLIVAFVGVWAIWLKEKHPETNIGLVDNGNKFNISLKYIPEDTITTEVVRKVYEYEFTNNSETEKQEIDLVSTLKSSNMDVSYAFSEDRVSEDEYDTLVGEGYRITILDAGNTQYIYLIASVKDLTKEAYCEGVVKWKASPMIDVTFASETLGTSEEMSYVKGEEIGSDELPSMPANVLGCEFAGWYLDENYLTAANFAQGFTSATTLYAKYNYVETDWIAWSEKANGYIVAGGSTTLPAELVIPNTYNDGEHGEANIVDIEDALEGSYGLAGGFYNNDDIVSVVLPSTITSLKFQAFGDCNNLKHIRFAPNAQITSIDSTTFDATNLKSIVIPASLTDMPLISSAELESIAVEEGNTKYTTT